jgi:hypothetical protein
LLRITVQEQETGSVLLLEGRLEGPWVPELEKVFDEQQNKPAGSGHITIDLGGLTGMDDSGESTLQSLYERGAILVCADVMNEYLVQRMRDGTAKPLEVIYRPCHFDETETT